MSKRDSFLLRLRPEVMDALRRWADDEFRSVNGQIEFVLARALQQSGRLPVVPSPQPSGDAGCDPPSGLSEPAQERPVSPPPGSLDVD
jgi:hypothetical protein